MSGNPILLDTCAAIWIMDNDWLRVDAVEAIDSAADRGEKLLVSPITAWEIGNQSRSGRFKSVYSPQRWLAVLLAKPQIGLAELAPHVLLDAAFLPGRLNNDPADRIFAATAREYGYTLMTRDRDLLRYAKEGHLSAIEC